MLDPYPSSIHCMSHNHNGTLLVTGGADGMIRLFGTCNFDLSYIYATSLCGQFCMYVYVNVYVYV